MASPTTRQTAASRPLFLACTRTKFAALKAVAQTTIYVRIGNDASKTLFNKQETSRIDATFSTLVKKVEAVLDKMCNNE